MNLHRPSVLIFSLAIAWRPGAATIPITNPSFEELTGNAPAHFDTSGKLRPGHWATFFESEGVEGFSTENAVPGWEGEGENGTMAPIVGTGPTAKFRSIPHGQNTYFGTGIGLLSQTLGARYSAGNRYSFEAWVGRPLSESPPQLWSGGSLLLLQDGEALAIKEVPSDLLPGEFRRLKVEYPVAQGDRATGKVIGVGISPGFPGEIHFDAVSLTVDPLPTIEPEIAPAVRLRWPAIVNGWYRIERTDNLSNPNWTVIVPRVTGTAAYVEYFEVATNSLGYYRVVPVPPP